MDYEYKCPTCKHNPRGYGDNSPCEWCGHNENYEPIQPQDNDRAVSLNAVKDTFKKWQPYMATRLHDFEKELFALPSVEPICEEREKGECPWYAG